MARPRKERQHEARNQLVEAFWKFAREIPVSDMKVDALAREAGCNRSTFYYHFKGISNLREYAVDSSGIVPVLAAALAQGAIGASSSKDPAARAMSAISKQALARQNRDFIWKHEKAIDDMCSLVYHNWTELDDWGIRMRLREICRDALGDDVRANGVETRILLEFMTNGLIGAMAYRGASGNALPFDRFVNVLDSEALPALMDAMRR